MKVRDLDIDEAIMGKPIITRGGKPVRIICYNYKSDDGRDILALVDWGGTESLLTTYKNGRTDKDRTTSSDIVMDDENFVAQKSFKKVPYMDEDSIFSLTAARNGARVCTRMGHPARIVEFGAHLSQRGPVLIALVNYGRTERIQIYNKNGKYTDSNGITCLDLITPTAK